MPKRCSECLEKKDVKNPVLALNKKSVSGMTRALFVDFSSLFPQPDIELGLVFREHAIDVLFHHLYVQGILAKHGCSP